MMNEVIKILTDAMSALSVPVIPLSADITDDSISYRFYTTSHDGVKEQIRLEIRINTKKISRAEEIKTLLLSTLVTKGDEPRNGYLSCEVNGGGQLIDEETGLVQTIVYFTISRKVR